MTFILKAIKVFFLFLAECVYSLSTVIYQLIIKISETNFFSEQTIKAFTSNVYVLLGVFMLFKVSFSLINYIVNPEDFTDKQKGVGKLVPNIMITLVLIVFTPRIFAELMDLQHLLISENFFGRIIMGKQYESYTTGDVGEEIASDVFNSFYYYIKGAVPDKATDLDLVGEAVDGTYRYYDYHGAFDSSYTAYDGIWDGYGHYHPLLSLVAAVILVLTLIQFCFDIAIRTVKFGFLQLIAPIPLISRIDPKSAKDGMFGKWFKMCYKTYLDLFVRLIALYFAIALIKVIMTNTPTMQTNASTGFSGFMVNAFLIIGTLMFAKQLPKLLEDLFGFKLDGGFTLNPVKRLEKDALGGKVMTGAAAGLAQGAIGAATGAGVGSLVTNTLGGALSNKGFKEAWNKGKTSNKNMRTALLEGSTFGGRMRKRVDNFIGLGGEDFAIEQEKHNIQDDLDTIDQNIKIEEDAKAAIKGTAAYRQRQLDMNNYNAAASATDELKKWCKQKVTEGNGTAGQRYREMQRDLEAIKKLQVGQTYSYVDSTGAHHTTSFSSEADMAAFSKQLEQEAETYLHKSAWKELATELDGGTNDKFNDMQAAANAALTEAGITINTSRDYGDEIDDHDTDCNHEIARLKLAGAADERAIAGHDRTIADLNRQKSEAGGPNDRMRDVQRRERRNKANETGIK